MPEQNPRPWSVVVGDTLDKVIRWGLLATVLWKALDVLGQFAGEETVVDFGAKLAASVNMSTGAAWALVALFGAWGYRESRLRSRVEKRSSAEIEDLRKRLPSASPPPMIEDASRTSEEK